MDPDIIYHWETLPEYVTGQQYTRCLGRIFCSLPARVRIRVMRTMTTAAILISRGIAGFNAEVAPGEHMSKADREFFRETALDAIAISREGLDALATLPRVNRPDLLVARALLDRIEGSVRSARVNPDRP